MDIHKSDLDGVLIITPPTIFEDFRGTYVETYNEELYKKNGIPISFVQDDMSTSHRNVLRGLHGDQETWKLVSCLYGEFYLVVANWDSTSPQYKKWISITLSDQNRLQVLIPPKFGNGHLILSDKAIFHYEQNTYYNQAGQFTILWNDPELNIKWPIKEPILSKRDSSGKKP